MITINFLQHRRNFIELFLYLLGRVKPENRKKLHINFLMTDRLSPEQWYKYKTDIPYTIYNFGGNLHVNNYRDKMLIAMENSDRYFIKLDEDIILSNHVWDYLIENIEILERDPNILLLTPAVNIGVPSTDLFIDDFCGEAQKKEIHDIFLRQDLQATAGNRWGEDFEELNQHTLLSKTWNTDDYWKHVSSLKTNLKGIHPVRVSYEAQSYLINCVMNDIGKFMSWQPYEIVTNNWPYLCNDMSVILTSRLRDIYKEKDFQPYDEIPTNLYKQEMGLKYGFIRRGWALHSYFAFVSYYLPDRHNFERKIYEKLRDRIYEYGHFDL